MKTDKMNLLMLITDQQRHDTLSCLGQTPCKTPNLDRIAREGVVFDHAFTPTPLCSPARASLLTGRYAHSHGCIGNCQQPEGGSDTGLPDLSPGEKTLSELLTPGGITCAYSGKWHLGREIERQRDYVHFMSHRDPAFLKGLAERGLKWDEMAVFERLHYRPDAEFCGTCTLPAHENRDAFVTRNAIRMLEELSAGRQPFGLWCSFYGPHQPFAVPAPWDTMYDPADVELPESFRDDCAGMPAHLQRIRRTHKTSRLDDDTWRKIIAHYWGYVSFLDSQFGLLLDRLEQLGLWENTAIVMTSDHGEQLGDHGLFGKNLHFSEGVMRPPLILRAPGLAGNRVETGLVSSVDIVPTILEAFGREVPANIQGRSLWTALSTGASCGAEAVFGEHSAAVGPGGKGVSGRMIRTPTHKLSIYSTGEEELYDLVADPGETRNLANFSQQTAVRVTLRSRLQQWMKQTRDPYPELPEFLRG